jgi:hypothetical protein
VSDEGPQFYDNAAVFQTYMQHRQRPENPNDTLKKPVIVELLAQNRIYKPCELNTIQQRVSTDL